MTNEQNHRNNKTVIANGFKRAREEHFLNMKAELSGILDDAMKDCVGSHDEKHHKHPDTKYHTYGWALYHNREKIAENVQSGGVMVDVFADVNVPNNGWVGVVEANMSFSYLDFDYEIGIMHSTIPSVKAKLDELFKPKRTR